MSLLTEKLVYHALKQKHGTSDYLIDDLVESTESFKIKNVCAKLSVSLSDRIDNTVGLLDMSKRQFIEAALITACDEAKKVIDDLGLIEHLTDGQ